MLERDSFSQQVHTEVACCRRRACCKEAFLKAVVAGAKCFRRYETAVLRLSSEVAWMTVVRLLEELGLPYSWSPEEGKEAGHFCVVELPHLPQSFYGLPELKRTCCRRAWMAGLFLVCGTVADPTKDYYFEWSLGSWDCTLLLTHCLADEGLHPYISERGKEQGITKNQLEASSGQSPERLIARQVGFRSCRQLVCLKRAEEVAEALSLVGATKARLRYEDIRAIKETSNDLHRLVNAETANIRRAAEAGARQVMAMKILREMGILEGLSPSLAELALLRLDHPELSYRELGEICHPRQTRASVAKRLAKLERLAVDLNVGDASSDAGSDWPGDSAGDVAGN